MFKLDFGSLANRLTSALDSLAQLAGTQTANLQTPGFNPTSGQTAALNNVARTLAEGQGGQQDDLQATAKALIDKYTPKNVLLIGKY